MENNQQYVIYPHEDKSNGLTPADKLIYLIIRKYMNNESMTSFVSYATITKDCGAAAKTIKKCVDNLVKEGYLEVKRDGKRLVYKFNNKRKFEPFSYDFLSNPNLTFTEKSYIVASQQYMFKDNEEGKISYTNKELSNIINMSPSTISRCNHSLETKGYLSGASELVKRFQLRELDQLFIWKFKEQDERIKENRDNIDALKRENAKMRAEIEELKRSINCSQTYVM